MRPITSVVFVVAMVATSGCSLATDFNEFVFLHLDGSVTPDAMPDTFVEPDAEAPDDADPGEDAFVPDSGRLDAGSADAGPAVDAFMADAEVPDSGPDADVMDAGPAVDAFVPDAGPEDTGPPDTGPDDAGLTDAGPIDSGPMDAGPPDTGPTDAGPLNCRDDPTQERCLIHIRFTSTPRIQYYWLKRYVRGVDGGPGMTEAWHSCNGGVRLIDATTSECVYSWVPVPGTEVTFVPGYDADTPACNTATCLAAPESVSVYDEALPMGAIMSVIESTPPVGSLPIAAFRFTVPSP